MASSRKTSEINVVDFDNKHTEKCATSRLSAPTSLASRQSKQIWCKQDQPIQVRAPQRFLFDFKKPLVEWDFTKASIRIEEDSLTMKVGGESVLEVSLLDNKLSLNWVADEWKSWNELQESPELASLISKANSTLEQARSGKGKGKGPAS